MPRGVPAPRCGRVRPPGGGRDARHLGRDVEIAGGQGADADQVVAGSRGEEGIMKCADLQTDVLVDLVDGRLDPGSQREIERHLEVCAECRALVTDLRSIRAAAFMLDRREPGAALWAKLQESVAAE